MPPTWKALASTTLGANASTITISSISSAYRDLKLVLTGTKTGSGAAVLQVRFNGNTGANYTFVNIEGSGGVPGTFTAANQTVGYVTYGNSSYDAGQISTLTLDLLDYSTTNKHKTAITTASTSSQVMSKGIIQFANTAAVSSIGLSLTGDSFATGTMITLYGVEA